MTAPTRTASSAAVEPFGWRLVLATLLTSVRADSLATAAKVAALAVRACGDDADAHLRADLRHDRVELTLCTASSGAVEHRDLELARLITDAVRASGADTVAAPASGRPVQAWELAVDALDIAAVAPFWRAVLAYVDDPAGGDALVDPAGQGPAVWFQQMDSPRPQRNRLHVDITVSHEEAEARVAAALAAGGVLVSDAHARMFWVLADAEGNEVCVCTWLDRDEFRAANPG